MADTNTILNSQEKVLEYIELTGAIMEKTSSMVAEKEARDTQINDLIPKAVQALAENDRIEPEQKEAAAKLLSDPVKTLEILIKTAAHKNASEQTQLGRPVENGTNKKASSNDYNSLNDNYVGRRSRPGEAESFKAFKRGLGL